MKIDSVKQVKIGTATLYLGDAFEILPTLGDGEIDMVASDPPYAAKSFGRKCSACDWDRPINLPEFWQLMECKTKPQANIALFCNMRFAYDLIGSNKNGFRYDLIWQKNNKVGYLNANRMPLRSHESILLFGRPGYKKTATYNAIKISGGRVGIRKTKRRGGIYRIVDGVEKFYDGTLHPGSVLFFDSDKDKGYDHPTVKPVALMEFLIRSYTNEWDTVIDCFMGSGSTGVAAVNTGRRFIGIENNEEYFSTACERIQKAYAELGITSEVSNGE